MDRDDDHRGQQGQAAVYVPPYRRQQPAVDGSSRTTVQDNGPVLSCNLAVQQDGSVSMTLQPDALQQHPVAPEAVGAPANGHQPSSPAASDASSEDPFAWMQQRGGQPDANAGTTAAQQTAAAAAATIPAADPTAAAHDRSTPTSWTEVNDEFKPAAKQQPLAAAGADAASCVLQCKICRWSTTNPEAAVAHFKGARHEEACWGRLDVCAACGLVFPTDLHVGPHQQTVHHKARVDWLRNTKLAPAAIAADAQHQLRQPPPPPPPPPPPQNQYPNHRQPPDCGGVTAVETSGSAVQAVCRVCNWQGPASAVKAHFQSAAHLEACRRGGRMCCTACGILVTSSNDMDMHRTGRRHIMRMDFLKGRQPQQQTAKPPPLVLPPLVQRQQRPLVQLELQQQMFGAGCQRFSVPWGADDPWEGSGAPAPAAPAAGLGRAGSAPSSPAFSSRNSSATPAAERRTREEQEAEDIARAVAASLIEQRGGGLPNGAASAGINVQPQSQAPMLVPPPAAARASAAPLLFSGPMTSAAPAAAPAAARQSSGAGAAAGYGNSFGGSGAGSMAAAGGGNVTKCRVCGWQGNSFQAYYHFKSQEHAACVSQARDSSPEQRICSPCGVWTPGPSHLDAHKRTPKHKTRVAWLAGRPPPQPPAAVASQAPPATQAAAPPKTELLRPSSSAQRPSGSGAKASVASVAPANQFHCDACNVKLSDAIAWKQHKATSKHKANVMKKVLAGEEGDGQPASDGEGSNGASATQQENAQQPPPAVAVAAAANAMQQQNAQQQNAQQPPPAAAAAAAAVSMPQLTEDELCCPITSEIMEDPVICSDGHTYERAAIESWLSKKDTSPMTGAQLTTKVLMPNMALRHAVAMLGKE